MRPDDEIRPLPRRSTDNTRGRQANRCSRRKRSRPSAHKLITSSSPGRSAPYARRDASDPARVAPKSRLLSTRYTGFRARQIVRRPTESSARTMARGSRAEGWSTVSRQARWCRAEVYGGGRRQDSSSASLGRRRPPAGPGRGMFTESSQEAGLLLRPGDGLANDRRRARCPDTPKGPPHRASPSAWFELRPPSSAGRPARASAAAAGSCPGSDPPPSRRASSWAHGWRCSGRAASRRRRPPRGPRPRAPPS